METIDLSKLSPAQLNELQKELANKQKQEEQLRQENIEAYKQLSDELVAKVAPNLANFSQVQRDVVLAAWAEFEQAIELKRALYGFKDSQASHTFTSRDGSASVCVGYNEIIGFDGTESAGVAKIREFITTLAADDDNRKVLASLLETFMKPNKKGELNPTRVAELIAQKDKVDNKLFHDGVDIIVNAQHKTRTGQYVKGWFKQQGDHGQEIKLEFSISTK